MNRRRWVMKGLLAAAALVVVPCTHVLAFRLYNPIPDNPSADFPRIRWWPADSPPPGNLPRMPIRYFVNTKNSDMGDETVFWVQSAAATWVELDGSDILFEFGGELTGNAGRGEPEDDRNTVSFGGDQTHLPSGVLGWTSFWFNLDTTVKISDDRRFHVMTEFDLIINDNDFRIGTPVQVGRDETMFDGLSVLTHEFGHALGFAHSSIKENETNGILCEATMFPVQQQGDRSLETLNEDDIDAANFSYTGTPTVTSVNPTDGSTGGGTTLTVNGTGFIRESRFYETWIENGFSQGPTVRIGGTLCTNVVVVSTSRITCRVPAMAAGTYDVVVVNPDDGSGRLDNAYTYISPAPSDLEVDTAFVTLSETSPTAVVTVSNAGGSILRWHAASAPLPVTLTPDSGTSAGGVTIRTTDFTSAWETTVTFTNEANPSDIETVTVRVFMGLDTDDDGVIDTVDTDDDDDGLTDEAEFGLGTDPLDADTDGDSMPDGYEVSHELDPLTDDADVDPDGDGLSNGRELAYDTDPQDPDTDDDSMPDGYEVSHELDPLANDADADPDGDGLSNGQESIYGTDPHKTDTDGDGDGYTDPEEIERGSDPTAAADVPAPLLTSVAIDPRPVEVEINRSFDFSVTGEMSDGSAADLSGASVRWDILTGTGSIDAATGIYETVEPGDVEIQVTVEVDGVEVSGALQFAAVDAALAIGSGHTFGDETVSIPVTLTSAGREVAAIEFVLMIDPQIVEPVGVGRSDESAAADKTVNVTPLDENAYFIELGGNSLVLTDGTVLVLEFRAAAGAQQGSRSLLLGRDVVFFDPDAAATEAAGIDGICWLGLPGDVDGDGSVDATDVQQVINAVLGITGEGNHDIDGDGQVSAVDVQLVINAALGLDIT